MAYGPQFSPKPTYGPPTNDDRTWAMLAHFSPLLIGFIGPLVIWLIKKDESAFVADQAKEALNFSITVILMSLLLLITCIGPIIMGFYALVMHIIAGMEANKGVYYRYSFCWRMID